MADQESRPLKAESPTAVWISRFEKSEAGQYALNQLEGLRDLNPDSFDALRERVLTDSYLAATFQDVLGATRNVEKERLADFDRIISLTNELGDVLKRVPDVRVPLSALKTHDRSHRHHDGPVNPRRPTRYAYVLRTDRPTALEKL